MKQRCVTLALSLALLAAPTAAVHADTVNCSLTYDLPADIPGTTSEATDSTFQQFGWQSFLGLNAPNVGGQISTTGDTVPQWAAWSATVDLLLCQGTPPPSGCVCSSGDCTESGTHYYPSQCQAIPNYQNYRVLNQVGKVDDSFEEAAAGALSGDPVVDRFGGFLRYEILLSPATYDQIIQQQLYDQAHLNSLTSDINLGCGDSSYTGGDPANADMGALVIKAAWMDVTDALQDGAIDASMYHLEQLLVYTPYYRNSTGEATCDLRTMALVGMHIAHKTTQQPNWIWSTFEHTLNAPDCTGPMPGPNTQQQNTSCPSTVSSNYNFYGENCNGNVQACMSCNAPPAANGNCQNPTTGTASGFCLDEPPAANGGISKLCRQVPIASYPEAATWNSACQTALGTASAWSNYSLISSQWGTSAIPAGCADVASDIFDGAVDDTKILPKVAAGTAMKPLLANTSMESYDRSNCLGCHAKATIKNSAGTALRTDFMYFLQLEVSAPSLTRPAFIEALTPGPTPTATPGPAAVDEDGCQLGARPQVRGVWILLLGLGMLALRRRERRVTSGAERHAP